MEGPRDIAAQGQPSLRRGPIRAIPPLVSTWLSPQPDSRRQTGKALEKTRAFIVDSNGQGRY